MYADVSHYLMTRPFFIKKKHRPCSNLLVHGDVQRRYRGINLQDGPNLRHDEVQHYFRERKVRRAGLLGVAAVHMVGEWRRGRVTRTAAVDLGCQRLGNQDV